MMHLQATESHAKDASKPPEASKNFPIGFRGSMALLLNTEILDF